MNEVEFYQLNQTLSKEKDFIKPQMLFNLIKDISFVKEQIESLQKIFKDESYNSIFEYLHSRLDLDNISEVSPKIVYYKEEPDFRIIQQKVGGYFTTIPLPNKNIMYVNEEGEIKNLSVNIKASKMVGYTIYGDVLIVNSVDCE